MLNNNSNSQIILALDFHNVNQAYELIEKLTPERCRLKVGLQMFSRFGWDFVNALVTRGFDVFLDLKFHDIPTTVANACKAVAELGVWMLNVHALGGEKMLLAARDAIEQTSGPRPLILAVTMLTSLSENDLPAIGLGGSMLSNVERLALLAKNCGLDGVVCSPQETQLIRPLVGDDFYLVTPGIRLVSDATDDQERVTSPEQAIKFGANFIVIGRSITHAVDPLFKLGQVEALIAN